MNAEGDASSLKCSSPKIIWAWQLKVFNFRPLWQLRISKRFEFPLSVNLQAGHFLYLSFENVLLQVPLHIIWLCNQYNVGIFFEKILFDHSKPALYVSITEGTTDTKSHLILSYFESRVSTSFLNGHEKYL